MNRIKLTINERILIHLIGYSGFEDEIEVPVDISQVGIADAIGIRWNNVPRAMRELKDKNMVVEKLLQAVERDIATLSGTLDELGPPGSEARAAAEDLLKEAKAHVEKIRARLPEKE